MAIIKCKMCGGDLKIEEGSSVAVCEYCGTKQTVPTADNEKKMTLFTRANRLLWDCEFDKAAGVYESIVAEFPEEAEAYWCLVLCSYGIEYVDDPANGKKVPTCHRSSFESVMDDKDFENAMNFADLAARRVYRDEAKQIEELRKTIIEVSGKEEPYDIFISYKETDENGDRTIDSVIAQDIYYALIDKGYRVFFSRISLEDKLGTEYEPYIFAALNSAKVMLCVGTDYEYFNAVWVKNEWSRFLSLIGKGEKKVLIPVFKNIDAYDMPKEFAKLSAQNMDKVGAMQDLLRGVDKIIGRKETAPDAAAHQQVVRSANGVTTDSLLKRGNMFLEDGDWKSADEYFNKVLDIDPENGNAYFGKLLAEFKSKDQEALKRVASKPTELGKYLPDSANYKRALQFCSEEKTADLAQFAAKVRRVPLHVRPMLKDTYELRGTTLVKYSGEQTEIRIPNDVTSIGEKAFFCCEALKEVYIPDSVTSIGEEAFFCCRALKEVYIPDSVTSIGEGAFAGCKALTEIYIPSSVTSIGELAFTGCESLTDIDISLANGYYTFADGVLFNKDKSVLVCCLASKSGEFTVPDSVTSIGEKAFFGCKALTEIYIPSSVTSIGELAFTGCESLTNIDISLANGYYTFADGALFNKNKSVLVCCLASKSGEFTVPDNVTSIEKKAFSSCKALTEVYIPNSVTSIGEAAFFRCNILKEIDIPDSVTSIGKETFSGCEALAEVYIPESVTSIGEMAFYRCEAIKEIYIPESVTSIGEKAFFGCKALKEVYIPDSVTSIGESAFWSYGTLPTILFSGSPLAKQYAANTPGVLCRRVPPRKKRAPRLSPEEQEAVERKAREEKLSSLNAEKVKLGAELPTLQGIFKSGRRKEVEVRLAAIERELKTLQ